jgi:hypothetical protein
MKKLIVLSAILAVFGIVGVVGAVWRSTDGSAAAPGPTTRLVIPGIARDSGLVESTRQVILSVSLSINEPALVGGGTTVIAIAANANGPLPGQTDPPVTVPVTLTITSHPGDVCSWAPTVASSNLTVTYSQPAGSQLRLHFNFSPFEWYYLVTCPGQVVRFPAAPVNESLTGWLGLVFLGLGGPAGMTIDTPVTSDTLTSCVKRKGTVTNTNQFGSGEIVVLVTAPPCLIPVE